MFLKSPNYYYHTSQCNAIKTLAPILPRLIDFLKLPYKPCKRYLFRGEVTQVFGKITLYFAKRKCASTPKYHTADIHDKIYTLCSHSGRITSEIVKIKTDIFPACLAL